MNKPNIYKKSQLLISEPILQVAQASQFKLETWARFIYWQVESRGAYELKTWTTRFVCSTISNSEYKKTCQKRFHNQMGPDSMSLYSLMNKTSLYVWQKIWQWYHKVFLFLFFMDNNILYHHRLLIFVPKEMQNPLQSVID